MMASPFQSFGESLAGDDSTTIQWDGDDGPKSRRPGVAYLGRSVMLKSSFLPRCMQCRRGLAMRILSVRLSVCLSVTRVDRDKTEQRSVQIYIPYKRTFSLVF